MSEQANTVSFRDNNVVVSLEVLHREDPDAVDAHSLNYYVMRVTAEAAGFKADFTNSVYLPELAWLKEKLSEFYLMSEGKVDWIIQEGFLMLTAERSRLGHICWTIELTCPSGRESFTKLLLEINNDQTYLPYLIREIEAVLEVFPVVEYGG